MVRTLYGRLRPLPKIKSRNFQQRGAAERIAINSPLQGTAADLVKLAMIRLHNELCCQGLRTRMLLQVHDELLFEAPPEELDAARRLVKDTMEKIDKWRCRWWSVAEICAGDNWRDAKQLVESRSPQFHDEDIHLAIAHELAHVVLQHEEVPWPKAEILAMKMMHSGSPHLGNSRVRAGRDEWKSSSAAGWSL